MIKQAYCINAQTDFITPSLWLSHSPDLNPVYFAMRGFCRTMFIGIVSGMRKSWTWKSCTSVSRRSGTVSTLDQPKINSERNGTRAVSMYCSWQGTFRTCIVNMTVLHCGLMQHACLIIYWIPYCRGVQLATRGPHPTHNPL